MVIEGLSREFSSLRTSAVIESCDPTSKLGARKVQGAADVFIGCRFTPASRAEQGLGRGHGSPAPIVEKGELIEIHREQSAGHAAIGSKVTLLKSGKTAI
jgi:hypothetical protein